MDAKLGVKEKPKASVCFSSPLSEEGGGRMEFFPKRTEQDEGRLICVARWKLKDFGVYTWKKEALRGSDGCCQKPGKGLKS